jgi:hypothetical protein
MELYALAGEKRAQNRTYFRVRFSKRRVSASIFERRKGRNE